MIYRLLHPYTRASPAREWPDFLGYRPFRRYMSYWFFLFNHDTVTLVHLPRSKLRYPEHSYEQFSRKHVESWERGHVILKKPRTILPAPLSEPTTLRKQKLVFHPARIFSAAVLVRIFRIFDIFVQRRILLWQYWPLKANTQCSQRCARAWASHVARRPCVFESLSRSSRRFQCRTSSSKPETVSRA